MPNPSSFTNLLHATFLFFTNKFSSSLSQGLNMSRIVALHRCVCISPDKFKTKGLSSLKHILSSTTTDFITQ